VTVEATAAARRMHWMDVLRGTSIVLVVFNHSLLFTMGGDHPPDFLIYLNTIFRPIRMPLMVFLSGMLLPRSLAKGTGRHIAGKVRGVLYPYLVWSVIVFAIKTGAAINQGKELDWGNLLLIGYSPQAHLWFLYYLFLFHLLAIPARRVPALAVAAAAVVVGLFFDQFGIQRFLLLFAFFMAGRWVAEHRAVFERALGNRWIVGVAVAGALSFIVTPALVGDIRYAPLSAPLVVLAVLAACKAGQSWAGSRPGHSLQAIGRDSLIFYLVHWNAVAFGNQLAYAVFGRDADVAAFLVATGTGLAAGCIAVWVVRRVPAAQYLFSLPKRATTAPQKSDRVA
jgi:uncharacterized membrane protein YcfT